MAHLFQIIRLIMNTHNNCIDNDIKVKLSIIRL